MIVKLSEILINTLSIFLVWFLSFFLSDKRRLFILDVFNSALMFGQGTWFWHVSLFFEWKIIRETKRFTLISNWHYSGGYYIIRETSMGKRHYRSRRTSWWSWRHGHAQRRSHGNGPGACRHHVCFGSKYF